MIPRFRYFIKTPTLIKFLFKLGSSNFGKRDKVPDLEMTMETYFNKKNALCVSSYRMGLYYVLKSIQMAEASEVLIAPITIPDAVNMIQLSGHVPVFVDMDLDDHNLCLSDLKNKLTAKSKVLVVTSLCGIGFKLHKIRDFCLQHDLLMIEDFSQCFGGRENNKLIGTFGDYGIASLSRGKTISAMAGGLIISNESSNMKIIKEMKKSNTCPSRLLFFYYTIYNIGLNIITSKIIFNLFIYWIIYLENIFFKDKWKHISTEIQTSKDIFYDNFPVYRTEVPAQFQTYFTNWQANLVSHMMKDIDLRNHKRNKLGEYLLTQLTENSKRSLPKACLNSKNNTFYHLPIHLKEGEKFHFLENILSEGVDSTGYGLNLCNEEKVFITYSQPLKNAKYIKDNSVFMPIHEEYSQKDMNLIANAVNKYFQVIEKDEVYN